MNLEHSISKKVETDLVVLGALMNEEEGNEIPTDIVKKR